MPPDWEPERTWARQLDLTLIPNLGPMSVAILDQWLAAGDDDGDGDGDGRAERPGKTE